MRVNKARRKLLKWDRYVIATGTQTKYYQIHTAHAKAYTNVMFANRGVPKGPRQPYNLAARWYA